VRVSFESALEAVRNIRDSARPDPPTPGEVWSAARDIDDRAAQAVRHDDLARLPEPTLTEEERQRNLLRFREIIEMLRNHHNESETRAQAPSYTN